MVNGIKLLIVLLVIGRQVNAQYTPLLDNHNEWQFTTCYFGCPSDTYFAVDDTIVGSYSYKILEGFHFINRNVLLREEIENRKVYLMVIPDFGSPKEVLLYDFSMEAGDSIELFNYVTPYVNEPGYFTLDSIQLAPLVDGSDYRHFYLSANMPAFAGTTNAIWIEGVGSRTMINAPGSYPDINNVGQLSCFFKNTELFYANTDSIPGCTIEYPELGLPETLETNYRIFPTISNDKVTIESDAKMDDVQVIRIDGRIVRTFTPNHHMLEIQVSSYPNGMYYVVVNQGQQSQYRMKFIKQ